MEAVRANPWELPLWSRAAEQIAARGYRRLQLLQMRRICRWLIRFNVAANEAYMPLADTLQRSCK